MRRNILTIGAGTEFKGIRKSFIPHKIPITDTLPGHQTLPSVPASVITISFGFIVIIWLF